MISIKQINEKDIDLCYELDSKTMSLWSKKQWANEFKKEGTKILGLLVKNFVIGICVFQVVLDEAQINYFVINQKFRKKGFGSYLMLYLIKNCEKLSLKKLLLEVSQSNVSAERFYTRFDFSTVGVRKNYYKDGSHALLKEKKLTTK
ncbi:ribosomal protein S18-alanine N-acetyltransferase [Prochlorococcus marinus]|uniref:ribosomal protein S18-alanine N-acetyltransferase n=1 Tax=Prochlorococcus marinus TaxID=1219 RepID=UPI00019003C5|nr:ribosomal protein S18-alanine N-acetyltransferase [Prochlorococcus marinus]EEE40578.1 putative ribosomal-protein-alanine acetyltransferase [Prochlorococcus marinus str. MIT 9202]